MEIRKSTHTIVLDSGPILKNEPTVSTLLAQSEALVTVPAVITEIRDATARSRVETTLLPFLTVQSPKADSLKTLTEFARKTGDYEVLSKPDLQLLALAYELECERNQGDWRLRKVPGQKGVNGAPPKAPARTSKVLGEDWLRGEDSAANEPSPAATEEILDAARPGGDPADDESTSQEVAARHASEAAEVQPEATKGEENDAALSDGISEERPEEVDGEDSDSGGWITASNIKKHQAKDANTSTKPVHEQKVMQVATITTDFAMQNVLLQMNLNLLSPSLQRVRHLKTYILRCHACFAKTKDMSKQFCARCGKPTLTRVSCSTLDSGEFKVHLKKNMQWNTRGDKFSIPKPVNGSSNGKINVGGGGKGGGKGGWGQALILAEDQKEYVQAMTGARRAKERDLMDEDYLPGILTGERGRQGGRPKVGAGRNINSRKRK